MLKSIKIVIVILILLIAVISFENSIALNINDEEETINVLKYDLNSSDDVEIIKMVINESDCFILYKYADKIALRIFEETHFSFNKYYKEFGGANDDLIGKYNFAISNGKGYDHLLVAFGLTSELKDNTFTVIFDGYEEKITTPNTEKYFLEIFRNSSDKDDSWGKIQY